MDKLLRLNIPNLYTSFEAPIAAFDCGDRCAPYNERHVPFCCDLQHAVPTAYQYEWNYLQAHTNLWRKWEGSTPTETVELNSQAPAGRVLIACLGHTQCQRGFRALSCRSFPFFPYVSRENEFLGMSYYWEYEDRCWVISNLGIVSKVYVDQFISTYDALFEQVPLEKEVFRGFSTIMRRSFGRRHRAIPLIHRNGNFYKVTPGNGRMKRVVVEKFPQFGVYKIASELLFPDELVG